MDKVPAAGFAFGCGPPSLPGKPNDKPFQGAKTPFQFKLNGNARKVSVFQGHPTPGQSFLRSGFPVAPNVKFSENMPAAGPNAAEPLRSSPLAFPNHTPFKQYAAGAPACVDVVSEPPKPKLMKLSSQPFRGDGE
ncbi:hypothetical protein ID866_3294, partial [Astraeus odoratus]